MKKFLVLFLSLCILNTLVPTFAGAVEIDQQGQPQGRFGRVGRFMGNVKERFNRAVGRTNRISSQAISDTALKQAVTNSPSLPTSRGQNVILQLPSSTTITTANPGRLSNPVLMMQTAQTSHLQGMTKTPEGLKSGFSQENISLHFHQAAKIGHQTGEEKSVIPQLSIDTSGKEEGGGIGRKTMESTEKAREGETPPPDPGESVWPEEQKEPIDKDNLLTAAAHLLGAPDLIPHIKVAIAA